ncbi:MAG: hypothetical protein BGN97_00825 [Microbacterium sp. 69-10]|uniref:hypothetical protein n=1 Tax=Microbacterium sp. 69-10 TaxID=1895783 RepID=UPI00095E41D1|nr:hypothetical protein [Microbacterium sp. 69-10]OJU39780.1 MAG: hypothetical protein BGN97_00825 [Microbacterium sp. 69-10]
MHSDFDQYAPEVYRAAAAAVATPSAMMSASAPAAIAPPPIVFLIRISTLRMKWPVDGTVTGLMAAIRIGTDGCEGLRRLI